MSTSSSSKLSPTLKHLLSLNANPPNLNNSKTFNHHFHHLLTDFHHTATSQKLKHDTWMIFTSAALVSLNCPSAFHSLWHSVRSHLGSHAHEELYQAASVIREASLKSISFIGIAKTINALGAFHATLSDSDPDLLPQLSHPPRRQHGLPINSPTSIDSRAHEIWLSIYKPFEIKLIDKLSSFHPDLPIHILQSHYGPLLSDPGPGGPVGRIGTSLIAVATLRSSTRLGPQLLSHVFGLKKAGVEVTEGKLDGVAEVGEGVGWLTSDEGAEWVIRSVDKLSHLVSSAERELGISSGGVKL